MATPEQYLQAICPAIFETAEYQTFIDISTNMTAQEFYGVNYEYAIALRAAHMWQLNVKRGDSAGPVTYRMEGRLAESYATPGVIKNELELTKYGMQLLTLMRSARGTVATTNVYVLGNEGVI